MHPCCVTKTAIPWNRIAILGIRQQVNWGFTRWRFRPLPCFIWDACVPCIFLFLSDAFELFAVAGGILAQAMAPRAVPCLVQRERPVLAQDLSCTTSRHTIYIYIYIYIHTHTGGRWQWGSTHEVGPSRSTTAPLNMYIYIYTYIWELLVEVAGPRLCKHIVFNSN